MPCRNGGRSNNLEELWEIVWCCVFLIFASFVFSLLAKIVKGIGPGIYVKYFLAFPPKNLSPETNETNWVFTFQFLNVKIDHNTNFSKLLAEWQLKSLSFLWRQVFLREYFVHVLGPSPLTIFANIEKTNAAKMKYPLYYCPQLLQSVGLSTIPAWHKG